MAGLFITFEGGDGAGKSTQARLLATALELAGQKVVLTREPGGTEIAEEIRNIVLNPQHVDLDDRTEALLFAASRAEHVAKKIRPALDAGAIVISDRFVDSSIAYQGIGRGLGVEQVSDINAWATNNLWPDITFLLDVEPAAGLDRVEEPNRLEAAGDELHLDVRAAFLELAKRSPERFVVLSAARPIEELAKEVLSLVNAKLGL
jgi:dTMP kinase